MTSDHKKPTAGFWITVALVAVLGYPFSWGPFLWLADRRMLPDSLKEAGFRIYRPLFRIANEPHENDPLTVVIWYGLLWCR